jgi:hypothetical protein
VLCMATNMHGSFCRGISDRVWGRDCQGRKKADASPLPSCSIKIDNPKGEEIVCEPFFISLPHI